MKPRYKVVADYPNSPFEVGQILMGQYISYADKYPHLFRLLPWYAERIESELPEYVKSKSTSVVYEVDKYDFESNTIFVNHPTDGGPFQFTLSSFLSSRIPSTLSDYETYQTQTK